MRALAAWVAGAIARAEQRRKLERLARLDLSAMMKELKL